jgi:hypothetical protein
MRLVTRGDLDGLTCAVLITSCEEIENTLLVHPQDITDKRVEITKDDILANLPYHPSVGKWFDHHMLTDSNERPPEKFEGGYDLAPSAARVVYNHYRQRYPHIERYEELLAETDRLDAAQLEMSDVTDPKDYILLGYTLDPRTGLGAFESYFRQLVDALKSMPIADVLKIDEVQRRITRIKEQDAAFREATQKNSKLDGNVIFTDFRDVSPMPVGNRFLVYTLFPEGNVSLRVHWGPSKLHVAAAVGHSIFNRTCPVKVGDLMSKYGGGGHKGAGTCLLPAATAEQNIAEIIDALKKDG